MFGSAWIGSLFSHLLLLMVLSSAAASTQTTILPTARTVLSMSVYKAVPDALGTIHRRVSDPDGRDPGDGRCLDRDVRGHELRLGGLRDPRLGTAIGVWIAFYYGLTGWTCLWYYRKTLMRSPRDLMMRGVLPGLGGLILFAAGGWSLKNDLFFSSNQSYTSWQLPFAPHWDIGGVFLVFLVSAADRSRLRRDMALRRTSVLPGRNAQPFDTNSHARGRGPASRAGERRGQGRTGQGSGTRQV